jgi:tetratricopeptide (TPR) repeat protein
MPRSFLDFPSSRDEVSDLGYDPDVTAALVRAYASLDGGEPDDACDALRPYKAVEMSKRQRARLQYVEGIASTRSGRYIESLEPLDEAINIALDLGDAGAIASLAAAQALSHYVLHQFHSAAHYYRATLDAWHAVHIPTGSANADDARFEIDILTRLSSQDLLLGYHREARRLLRSARSLTSRIPDGDHLIGAIEWNLALLDRWRGEPESALRHGVAALAAYSADSALSGLARLRTVLTDITLDLANVYVNDTMTDTHDRLLTLAEPHLIRALADARLADDPTAEAMASLAFMRYLRASRDTAIDRLSMIESVIWQAENLGDMTLLGQALTAQGDELAAQRQSESSQRVYHTAVNLLTRIGAPGLGVQARRAILRGEEGVGDVSQESDSA